MAEFNEKELKAHIRAGEFLPVYVFYGDEDYLKKSYADMLCRKAVEKEFFDFNFQSFDGKNLDFRDVFDAAIMLPLMSSRRCVFIRDAKIESINDADYSLFRDYFEKPSESTTVVFLQANSDFSPVKAKRVLDLVKSKGAVCVLNKRQGNELVKPLISSATKQGCVLSLQAANYLVSVVGDDYNTLINEVNKLCSFVGEGEITKEHIDELAVKCDDAKIYDLTKFLLAKNFDKAYGVLNVLMRQRVEPEYILGTIVSTYVDMYRVKVSLACGKPVEELAETYGYGKNLFRLRNAARDSSRLDLDVLRRCLDELSAADMKLKSGRDNAATVLEQLMVRLFLVSGGEKI
ncbi:MAG: DNA polymerase III subunit delta [Clostridia bacterium]|nr:DNA polymerase III subunit delta [Clostridia bacterium]